MNNLNTLEIELYADSQYENFETLLSFMNTLKETYDEAFLEVFDNKIIIRYR